MEMDMKSGFEIIVQNGLTTVLYNQKEVGWIQRDLNRCMYRALTESGVVYHCNSKDAAFERITNDYYKENRYAAH
jgi:hypothetical protein